MLIFLSAMVVWLQALGRVSGSASSAHILIHAPLSQLFRARMVNKIGTINRFFFFSGLQPLTFGNYDKTAYWNKKKKIRRFFVFYFVKYRVLDYIILVVSLLTHCDQILEV